MAGLRGDGVLRRGKSKTKAADVGECGMFRDFLVKVI